MSKSIKEMVIDRFFGAVIQEQVKTQVEANEKMRAASMSDLMGPADMVGWRRLTTDVTRDLPPVTQTRMIEISHWLWKTNIMANWIIETMVSFVVGDGIKLKADEPAVQELLDKFWSHPVNDMAVNLEKNVRELGIFGEQCWPKFIGFYSGQVALGYIDPIYIKTVLTDPENCKIRIAVITMGHDFRDGKKYKIALDPEVEDFLSPDARSIRESCDENECYFFTINNVTNAPRGTSDLFTRADWLDIYEQFLYDYSEKLAQFNMFVWDLMVKGGDEKKIGEVIKAITKKSGAVWGHNEQATLDAKMPDFKSANTAEASRLFRNHILAEYPEHWFGGGGDVNRAAAMEMGTPVFKRMTSRQKFIQATLEFVGNDVIREADKRGMLSGVKDDPEIEGKPGKTRWAKLKCRCEVPEMVTKDLGKFGTVISQLAAALVSMVSQNLCSRDTAIKSFSFALELIGLQVNPADEKAAIEEDVAEKEQQDYTKNPAPAIGETGQDSGTPQPKSQPRPAPPGQAQSTIVTKAQG